MDSGFSCASAPAVNGHSLFLTVSEVASLLNVSAQSVRHYEQEGKIPSSCRSPGGHRRFIRADLERAGIITSENNESDAHGENNGEGKKYILYARCSSFGQSESVDRQIERMKEWILTTYNIPESELQIIREIKSAFNKRPGLLKILDRFISPNAPLILFTEYQDRLTRYGRSEMSIIEHFAKKAGTKIIFAKKTVDENDPDASDMASELLSIIQHFSNRAAANRSALVNTIKVPEEHMEIMIQLYCDGHKWNSIRNVLKNRGIKNTKNRFYHHNHIAKIMKDYFKKNGVPDSKEKEKNRAIQEFLKTETVKDKTGKIFSTCLWTAFKCWTDANNHPYLPMGSFFHLLKMEHNLQVKPSSYGANAVRGINFKRKEWAGASKYPYSRNKNHLQEICEKIKKEFQI